MTSETVASATFRTDEFGGSDQFDAWRERISVIFNVAPRDNDVTTGFHAEAHAFHLGELVMVRCRFEPQQFMRTPSQVRADMLDHYLVQLYRKGGYVGVVGGDDIDIHPGSVSVLDLAQPLHTHALSAENVSLVIPRDIMEAHVPNAARLHGRILDPSNAGLLADYFRSLEQRLPGMAADRAPHIANATTELLAACLQPTVENRARARHEVQQLQLEKIRRFVDQRVTSPVLTPGLICRELQLTEAELEGLFENTGGAWKFIQTRRLARVHALLADPAEKRSIIAIGEQHGFTSYTELLRAFRMHFGYPPSEVQGDSESGDPLIPAGLQPASSEREPGFDTWIQGLRN